MASSEDNNSARAYGNLPQDLRLDSSKLPVLVRSQLILPKIFDFSSYFERLLPFFTKYDDKNGLYYYICLIMLFIVYICSHSRRMEMMDPPFWGHKLIWTPIQIFWGMLIFICSNYALPCHGDSHSCIYAYLTPARIFLFVFILVILDKIFV